jgi:molecular chaperone GrpE
MATNRDTDHEQQPKPSEPGPDAPAEAAPRAEGSPDAQEEPVTPPSTEERATELAAELERARERHLRLAADFENYKKRTRQEQLDTMRYAAAVLAERLLPVLDDAERALDHAPEGVDQGWLKGVRMTFQKLEEVLASVGVERIESVGSRFDPNLHEAIGSEESTEHPEDTVLAELRRGYRLHDRVLRPALVKVARPRA